MKAAKKQTNDSKSSMAEAVRTCDKSAPHSDWWALSLGLILQVKIEQ